MTLRAVVFDLWGTLLLERPDRVRDRPRLRYEGVTPILARYGLAPSLEEFTRAHLASNRAITRAQEQGRDVSAEDRARHVIYQLAPGLADRIPDTDAAAFTAAYSGVIARTPPALLEGAAEALDEARRRGLRIGLISNTGISAGRHLRGILASFGLLDAFDALLFSDEQRRSKPHPAIFAAALDALEVEAGDALFVGDTPRYDVAPPRRLGWWVVQVGDREDGDPPAHARVAGVGELFGALDLLGIAPPAGVAG